MTALVPGAHPASGPTPAPNSGVASRARQAEQAQEQGQGLQDDPVAAGKAGPGRGKKTGDNVTRFERGNQASYLSARIARDYPDILERMKAGEFPSVRQAAIAAGIVKVPTALERARAALLALDRNGLDQVLRAALLALELDHLRELLSWVGSADFRSERESRTNPRGK
jgi:hypothetical protein